MRNTGPVCARIASMWRVRSSSLSGRVFSCFLIRSRSYSSTEKHAGHAGLHVRRPCAGGRRRSSAPSSTTSGAARRSRSKFSAASRVDRVAVDRRAGRALDLGARDAQEAERVAVGQRRGLVAVHDVVGHRGDPAPPCRASGGARQTGRSAAMESAHFMRDRAASVNARRRHALVPRSRVSCAAWRHASRSRSRSCAGRWLALSARCWWRARRADAPSGQRPGDRAGHGRRRRRLARAPRARSRGGAQQRHPRAGDQARAGRGRHRRRLRLLHGAPGPRRRARPAGSSPPTSSRRCSICCAPTSRAPGSTNVTTVLGAPDDPKLPAGVDRSGDHGRRLPRAGGAAGLPAPAAAGAQARRAAGAAGVPQGRSRACRSSKCTR